MAILHLVGERSVIITAREFKIMARRRKKRKKEK
jgi:hypothetical protein